MQLHGSARVTLLGKEMHAALALDLDAGHIELVVERSSPPIPFEQLAVFQSARAVAIKALNLSVPGGLLSKGEYDNFYVSEYIPNWQPGESNSSFAPGGTHLSKLVLQPRSSLLTFEVLGKEDHHVPSEIVFEVSMVGRSDEFDATVCGVPVRAIFRGSTLTLRSETSVDGYKEGIMCALGMLFGGPASLRSSRNGNRLSIDISPHAHGSTDRLWLEGDDIAPMFQAFVNLFCAPGETRRSLRPAMLHLHGLGDRILLDLRIISLYTSLEMLDGSDTLQKASVAKLLEISEDQAELVCHVRHALVHDGASISEAVIERRKRIATKSGSAPIELGFPIDEVNRSRTSQRYYFWFAAKLNTFWLKQANFRKAINDYSFLINPPSA